MKAMIKIGIVLLSGILITSCLSDQGKSKEQSDPVEEKVFGSLQFRKTRLLKPLIIRLI